MMIINKKYEEEAKNPIFTKKNKLTKNFKLIYF